jgi:hypothetical protein
MVLAVKTLFLRAGNFFEWFAFLDAAAKQRLTQSAAGAVDVGNADVVGDAVDRWTVCDRVEVPA